VSLCQRKQRLGSFLDHERQVDLLPRERSLLGSAEQEERLREADRPGVDHAQPFDELARV